MLARMGMPLTAAMALQTADAIASNTGLSPTRRTAAPPNLGSAKAHHSGNIDDIQARAGRTPNTSDSEGDMTGDPGGGGGSAPHYKKVDIADMTPTVAGPEVPEPRPAA